MARLIALLLLLTPVAAHADPISVTIFFAQFGMGSLGVFVANYGMTIVTGALLARGVYEGERAKKKARDAYNKSLQDRILTIRSGVSTRKYVLGTARVGGTLLYADTIGTNQIALDMVRAHTANTTSLVGWYIDDEYVPAADFPGTKYGRRKTLYGRASQYFSTGGAKMIVLPDTPVSGTVRAWVVDTEEQISVTVDGNGVSFTLSGAATVEVAYSYMGAASMYGASTSGTSVQSLASWGANYPSPLWGSTHQAKGTTLTRTLMLWDEDVYQSGAPEISPVLTGIGVARTTDTGTWYPYDPRTSTYSMTGTTNPALLAAWWMTLPREHRGCGIPEDWIDWDSVAAAANVCDELITVRKHDGSGYEQIKRYECNTVLDTSDSPTENLEIILSAMAGKRAFTAGKYRILAGAFRPATLTITDDMTVGTEPITVLKSTDASPPNTVTAKIADATKNWQETSPPQVVNATYVLADGGERSFDLPLPATTDPRQANYLMGVELERRRPAMRCTLHVGGVGEDLALYDTVQLDLTNRSQYVGKTFEIVRITDKWNGTFDLTLVETKATTYALDADRFTPINQPAPPDLSYYWNVAPIENFDVLDGQTSDGIEITWDLHSQSYVRDSGWIELRYRRLGESAWRLLPQAAGDSTGTTLSIALVTDATYEFQARAVNRIGATSPWAYEFATVVVSIPNSALTSLASHGMSITPDPGFEDLSLWTITPEGSGVRQFVSWNRFGKYLIKGQAASCVVYSKPTPIDVARNYRALVVVNSDGDAPPAFLTVFFFDENGAFVPGSSIGWPSWGSFYYFGLINQSPPAIALSEYTISFGPSHTAKIPTGTKSVAIGALLHYDDGLPHSGANYLCHARIQQLQDTELLAPNAATDVLVIRTAGYTVDGSNNGGYYGVRTSPSTGTQGAPDLAWTNNLGEAVDVIVRGSASMSVWVHASNPAPHVRHGFVGIYSADASGLPIALLDLKTAVTTPAVAGSYAGSGAPSYSLTVAAGQTVRFNLYCHADGSYNSIRPVGYAVSDGQLSLEVIKR